MGWGRVWRGLCLRSDADGTKSAIAGRVVNISGLIPLTQTLFLWQRLETTLILIVRVSDDPEYLSTHLAGECADRGSYGIQYLRFARAWK